MWVGPMQVGVPRTDTWLPPPQNVQRVSETPTKDVSRRVPAAQPDALSLLTMKLLRVSEVQTTCLADTIGRFHASKSTVVIYEAKMGASAATFKNPLQESDAVLWLSLHVRAILAAKAGEMTLPFKLPRISFLNAYRLGSESLKDARNESDFLEAIYSLAKTNETQHATDMIFYRIDKLLCKAEFEQCDGLLRQLDIRRLPTSLMRSFLTITYPAKDKLKSRTSLFASIREEFIRQRGEAKTKRLLDGLA